MLFSRLVRLLDSIDFAPGLARPHTLALAQLALALLFSTAACSDSSSPRPLDGSIADLARDSHASAEMALGDSARPTEGVADAHAAGDGAVVDLATADADPCAVANSVSCFANLDCDAARRCENVGNDTDPLACCVTGARGTKAAGELCTGENDCESGVCIAKGAGESRCSRDCTGPSDCPVGMQRCMPIAFSGSPLSWCFPES